MNFLVAYDAWCVDKVEAFLLWIEEWLSISQKEAEKSIIALYLSNCAENPVLQDGDAERGERSSPQLGVCCCSMYWRMMEMGAPPQLPAK